MLPRVYIIYQMTTTNQTHGANTMANYNNAGSKFNTNMTIVEIAKALRKDIKAMMKAGRFEGMKVSVRVDRYSMGQALDITITKWNGDIMNADFVKADCDERIDRNLQRYVPAARMALATLTALAGQWNYDNSDSMTDYYDVNYAVNVTFDRDLFEADWAAKKAA